MASCSARIWALVSVGGTSFCRSTCDERTLLSPSARISSNDSTSRCFSCTNGCDSNLRKINRCPCDVATEMAQQLPWPVLPENDMAFCFVDRNEFAPCAKRSETLSLYPVPHASCRGVNVHFSSLNFAPPSTFAPRSRRMRSAVKLPRHAANVNAVQCCVSGWIDGQAWWTPRAGTSIFGFAPQSRSVCSAVSSLRMAAIINAVSPWWLSVSYLKWEVRVNEVAIRIFSKVETC